MAGILSHHLERRRQQKIWRCGKRSDIIRAMTQPILNPVDLPPLLPAEKKFAHCLGKGVHCRVGTWALPERAVEYGEGANLIRPEVIRFFACRGNGEYPVRGSMIYLQGAWIGREKGAVASDPDEDMETGRTLLNLQHMNIPYGMFFAQCHFAVVVNVQHMKCAALYMDGSKLTREMFADGIKINGVVHLRDGFSAESGVRLIGATINGPLDCSRGEFCHPKRQPEIYALLADELVAQDVLLSDGFSAKGKVGLSGANIGGNLTCAGGTFHASHAQKSEALHADGLTVKGNVYLDDGFSAVGEVRLLGANIGGKLDCGGGAFDNPKGYALNAERVKTGGHVYLNKHAHEKSEPFIADGRVRFANADIGGNFNCKGGQFSYRGDEPVIAAGGLRSRGAVFFSHGFSVKGNVALHVARIGNFVCKHCASGKGIIDLSSTEAVAVDDDGGAGEQFEFVLDDFTYGTFYPPSPTDSESRLKWLAMRPKIPFSPLPYEQAAKVLFGMGQAREAREILLKKERLQTKDERTPWHHKIGRRLWDVFAGYGYRLRKTAAWMAGFVTAGAMFFGIAAHHGQIVPHQPPILSSAEYQAERAKGLSPMESVQAAFPKEYPEFSPLAYSLDVFIPFFALHQEPFWSPVSGGDNDLWKASLLLALLVAAALALGGLASLLANWIRREWGDDFAGAGAAGVGLAAVSLLLGVGFAAGVAHVWLDFDLGIWLADWRWLTVWHWLEIGAGWVLTSLFLLSITGLLRPRQSSGEKG